MADSFNRRRRAPSWREPALALVAALEGRGLVATVAGHGAVRAENPAGQPEKDDPRGRALGPGLRQEVRCRHQDDGSLWWFWVWWAASGEAEPDTEPLCPIADTETAADRIARVLAAPYAYAAERPVTDGGL
ncbi:hypothetical protein [Actinomadura napierensis]|uniref:Uncharacterized protein n=1 Tax=Actinomadura napierensis TaxID=267854 RepID=A0ABP5M762_9ACTN